METLSSKPPTLSQEDVRFVAGLMLREAAVVLEDDKDYLVENRLSPLAKKEGYASVSELIALLRRHPHPPLIKKLVNVLTTHATSFYRDPQVFEALHKTILPELIASRGSLRALNAWSAACSTGQEPYSFSIQLREHFPELAAWNVYLLATDISNEALDVARRASYRSSEINRGMPARLLLKYFKQVAGEWVLQEDLRKKVDFREMNLAAPWPPIPQMDLIFLRNVLIYFGTSTKREVLQRAYRILRPDGFLILGSSETTLGLEDAFEQVPVDNVLVYRKKASHAQRLASLPTAGPSPAISGTPGATLSSPLPPPTPEPSNTGTTPDASFPVEGF